MFVLGIHWAPNRHSPCSEEAYSPFRCEGDIKQRNAMLHIVINVAEAKNSVLGERMTGKSLSEGHWGLLRVFKQGPCIVWFTFVKALHNPCVEWFLLVGVLSCVPSPGIGCLEFQSQESQAACLPPSASLQPVLHVTGLRAPSPLPSLPSQIWTSI